MVSDCLSHQNKFFSVSFGRLIEVVQEKENPLFQISPKMCERTKAA